MRRNSLEPGEVSPGRNWKIRIGLWPRASAEVLSTRLRVAARIREMVSLVIGSVMVKNWPGDGSPWVGACACPSADAPQSPRHPKIATQKASP